LNNRIVITGGGGSGKSSVIKALMKRGIVVFEEQSRQIIKQSLAQHSTALPWLDIVAFSRLVQNAMIADYAKAPKNKICFFDRSLCDVLAYLEKDNVTVYPDLLEDIEHYRYQNTVFIMPPWEEIFENDVERKESFGESVAAFEQLKKTYTDRGYRMLEIPKIGIEKRVNFILSSLSKSNS
jgi:predicted ATPase